MAEFKENWIDWVVKNWYEPYSLLLSLPISYYFSVQAVYFFGTNSPAIEATWQLTHIVAIVVALGVFIIWRYSRKYPKRRENKIGIVVAIRDNTDQAKKVKCDVLDKFMEVIHDLPSGHSVQLLVLKDFQAKRVVDEPSAIKASSNTDSQFVIWGKTLNYGDRYSFDLHFLVRHRPLKQTEKAILKKGFADSLVDKNWQFLERDVFTAIQATASNIREIAWYVIGIAAHLSFDFQVSRSLHSDLLTLLKGNNNKKKELSQVFQRLPVWIADSCAALGLDAYYRNDLERALVLTDEALQYQPDNYSARLNKARYLFIRGDISAARALIRQIRRQNGRGRVADSAWRYSEAFLITLDGNIERGVSLYKKAFSEHTTNLALDSVVEFIEDYLQKNPDKKIFLFVLGLLYMRMKNNYPEALYKLETFLQCLDDNPDLRIFENETKICLSEVRAVLSGKKAM